MKNLIPQRIFPLSIFQILGTTCCGTMAKNFAQKRFSKELFCYDAPSILAANTLILWGGISPKLSALIVHNLHHLPLKNHIVHIHGCKQWTSFGQAESLLASKIHKNYALCHFEKSDVANLLNEARLCLKA